MNNIVFIHYVKNVPKTKILVMTNFFGPFEARFGLPEPYHHHHDHDHSRPAAGQAVTWCALSLCIANSLNQQYGAAAPGDEKPGPFFGDPML